MRVALVHDDLVQWGGAERVLLGLCEIYPDAPIFTSFYDRNNKSLSQLGQRKVITSFLQKIPGWRSMYKLLLPFYPIAFEQFNFNGYDLVISNTTRFAKSIITKPETVHICYCHTPPRFLWHFSGEGNFGLGEVLMSKLRLYDQVSAQRVDHFIAGSDNARKRIKKIYRVDSKIVYPFVDLERFKNIDTFDGGYFVVVGRQNKYKRFDLAKEACKRQGFELKIIDGSFSDEAVISVLAGCRALIIPGEEDFGISSLEAQALGKPVIAYRGGGALETVIEGKTGIFFNPASVESLSKTLLLFNPDNFESANCRENARGFSKENFIKNFKQTVASLL